MLTFARSERQQALPDEHVAQGVDVFPDALSEVPVPGDFRQFLAFLLPWDADPRFHLSIRVPGHAVAFTKYGIRRGCDPGMGRRRLGCARCVHPVVPREVRQGPQVLDAGVILHNGAGIHDVTAVLRHAVDDLFAVCADIIRGLERQYGVGYAAAQAEFVAQYPVRFEDVALVHMVHDALIGKFREALQVMAPIAFGVEQGLVPVPPQFLENGFGCGPVMRFKLTAGYKWYAAPVHPVADRNLLVGVRGIESHVVEVGHEGFAGCQDLVRLVDHVHRQPDIAAQLVADDVKGRLQDAGDRGHRPGLGPEAVDLRTERGEVVCHRHAAFHQSQVVAVRSRFSIALISVETRGSHFV